MTGSPIRDTTKPSRVTALTLAAGIACALTLTASTANAEPRRARVEPRARAYSEHQVPRHDRGNDRANDRGNRSDNHSHRRDTFGWYGTPSRSSAWCSPSSTVVLSGGFGATILYDRWGRRCDNPSYAYYGPSSLYTYRYGYTRYGYSPSYRYTLVDVDPDIAATQQRIGTPTNAVSDNDFHAWQLAQRDAARAAAESAAPQSTAAYRPGAPSVSTSPTAITKGTAASPSAEAVKPDPPRAEPLSTTEASAAWKALEEGRLLEAQSHFARGADAPAIPGSPDHRATLSAGFAITATMLNREEAAAWALRRAFDLDPEVAAKFPWTDALREKVRDAAKRIDELHTVQPTQDRALLLKRLNTLAQ